MNVSSSYINLAQSMKQDYLHIIHLMTFCAAIVPASRIYLERGGGRTREDTENLSFTPERHQSISTRSSRPGPTSDSGSRGGWDLGCTDMSKKVEDRLRDHKL